MNMMVRSVSHLAKHIIVEILIPRLEKERNKFSDDAILNYRILADDEERLYQLAKLSVSGIKERFQYLKAEDLEDFISNVISTTIQNETNDYHVFLKSRNGFWSKTFEVLSEKGFLDFGRTFSYFLFKAVQSETRTLHYRFKHEVSAIDDSEGNLSIIEEMEDSRDDERSYRNFDGFEEGIEKIKAFAETTKEFDDLDKKIFNIWFAAKDTENFTESINMIKTVYMPIIDELAASGTKITPSALHFRWKRIRLFLKDAVLSA